MDFSVQIEHWHSIRQFKEHLAKHSPAVASWASGVVIHHTWKPTVAQWQGRATMDGIVQYYKNKGWTSAPHLFVVSGSPSFDNDGIWQLTPLNMAGTHAGAWNSTHWGIEVVGNYDDVAWSPALRALVVDTTATLLAWRGVPFKTATVLGHRETGSKKSCPGRKIDMYDVRSQIKQQLEVLSYGLE